MAEDFGRRVEYARAVSQPEYDSWLHPLGAESQTIPLRNIASVDTSVKFNMGNFIIGAILAIAGLALFGSNFLVGLILLVLGW